MPKLPRLFVSIQYPYFIINVIDLFFIFTVSLLNKKDDSCEYDLVPPDGGWGWLVLFGACLTNILIPGTIKSFGVLFIEFTQAFEVSQTKSSWIPALCYFLYSSLGKALNNICISVMIQLM